MGPGDLRDIMGDLAAACPQDAAVLVGTETGDDAAVYKLTDELALVVTADYITPLIDDPLAFGQIAAANALSDVYAMGGRPQVALNLCIFPRELDPAAAREILRGAQEKVAEAGAAVLGGHTVRGQELLFGLSVTGTVHPQRVLRNVGAQPGDVLLLTKPLGTGLLISGYRKGLSRPTDMTQAVSGMTRLNRGAAEVLARFPVHAATDVTGFGLVGHALGMTRAGIALRLDVAQLPVYPGALELAAQGVTCAGAKANRQAYAAQLTKLGPLAPEYEELIHDPQTSGGLLAALPAEQAPSAVQALLTQGIDARIVGEAVAGPPQLILRGSA